jgi:hypothetical protein
MSTQENLETIFSILHDGTIESWSGDKLKLNLKVSCSYLAERINKSFEYFFIELQGISKIKFEAWVIQEESGQRILTEMRDIFSAELGILTAKKERDYVVVSCNQDDRKLDYCGGTLSLSCEGIKINDQDLNPLTIEFMKEISSNYWEKFGN